MLLTSFQSSDFVIFKNICIIFFFFAEIMHLFHVQFCQTTNFGISIQSEENMSDSALQVSSKQRLRLFFN